MGRVWGSVVVAVALLACVTPRSSAASGPPNVIRVGGPSDPNDSKIAVVGSSTNLAGKRFRVLDDTSTVVLTGKLHKAPRARSAESGPLPWNFAETADLSSITTPGEYRVRVGRMTSPPWDVYAGAAGDLRDTLLGFFPIAAELSSPVHADSHTNDATLITNNPLDPNNGQHFDLTGGWMDAGDPDKWVFTTGFATWALEIAARMEPTIAGIQLQADTGIKWLLKMHPKGTTLFVGQVGNAAYERDHFGFRNPADDELPGADPHVSNRPAYETRRSDVAGKAAAALALASTLPTGESSADELQTAQEWYAMGKASQTATNDPSCNDSEDTCTYDDNEWVDDMALAGVELYNATGTQSYLDDAYSYLQQARSTDVGAGPDAYTTDPFAAAELCGALGGLGFGTNDQLQASCGALAEDAGIAAGRARNAFLRASENSISTSCRGAAEGIVALAADRALVATTGAIAANERDYLLGRNPWGLSFVVGFSLPSTEHPYHWLADPVANPNGAINGGEPTGWLVPGPTSRANFLSFGPGFRPAHGRFDTKYLGYADNHDLFHYNEGAVDCQASGVLLAAMLAS